jgi:hypothetical protein
LSTPVVACRGANPTLAADANLHKNEVLPGVKARRGTFSVTGVAAGGHDLT